MSQRHNVFISYHHANDEAWKLRFESLFHHYYDILISRAVDPGDIDPNNKTDTIRAAIRDRFIAKTSVTVVLIGSETWKRKHVDWEIGYSLTTTQQNLRNGLVAIWLPANPGAPLPPRLTPNVANGYAAVYPWSDNPLTVQDWIHLAFLRRSAKQPDNSLPYFGNNR